MGVMGDNYKILIGKLESMRPLGRYRYRCEDNIKIDVIERVLESRPLDWIRIAQERDQRSSLVKMVLNKPVPYTWEFLD
jgi:hypothetical protein